MSMGVRGSGLRKPCMCHVGKGVPANIRHEKSGNVNSRNRTLILAGDL